MNNQFYKITLYFLTLMLTCLSLTAIGQPIARCKPALIYLDSQGNATVTTSDVDNGSDYGILFVSPDHVDCTNLGTINFTLYNADPSTNQYDSCTNTLTVLDIIAPVAVGHSIDLFLDPNGYATLNPQDLDSASYDNCGIMSYDASQLFFSCSDIGQNQITLTVTDGSGNVGSCVVTVNVMDVTPPVIQGAQFPVLLDNGMVDLNGLLANLDGGSTDECSSVTIISATPNIFTCTDVGLKTVYIVGEDASGNQAYGVAIVEIIDGNSPSANCKPFTLTLDASGNGYLNASDVDNGSSDDCGTVTLSLSQDHFDQTQLGQQPVMLTVTDAGGNQNSCVAIVTVQLDTNSPVASCQFAQIEFSASGVATLLSSDADAGSYDPEGGPITYSFSPATFDCSAVNQIVPYTMTVTDAVGNSSSCDDLVYIIDATAPTAVCQNINLYLDANGNYFLTAEELDGGSSDNNTCSPLSFATDIGYFDCSNLGLNYPMLTVTDISGLAASCFATVNVIDSLPPTAIGNYLIADLDATGNVTIPLSHLDGGSYDNCSATLTVTSGRTSFDCSDVGTINVPFTIEDGQGNSSIGNATVQVNDYNAPVAVCQDFTLNLPVNGTATLLATDIDNGSYSVCPGTLNYSVSPSQFDVSNVGVNQVVLVVLTTSGLVNTCYSNVTVVQPQNLPPVASCQFAQIEFSASGVATLLSSDADAGSYDPEGGPITYSFSPATFDCSTVNQIVPYTMTVTDAVGNSSSCDDLVYILDATAPTAVCQNIDLYLDANGSSTITSFQLDAGSTDNNICTPLSFSASNMSFTCANLGTNSVELTVTDGSGLTSTCTSTITVLDTISPVITCPGNAVLTYNPAISGAVYTYSTAASDNCGTATISYPLGFASGSTFPLGTTMVIVRAQDAAGNSSQCSFTVTVISGSLSPTLSLSADTAQYSDQVTLSARIPNGAAASAAQSVTFKVGTQTVGTVTLTTSGADLIGSLNMPLLEPTPYATSPTGQMAPGAHRVTATFNNINPAVALTANQYDTLVITTENAQATYSGTTFAYTTSNSSGNAVVTLGVTVKDISALAGSTDANAGDIRNARVTFVNRDNGSVIVANLPVSLVTSSDSRIGTVNYNWSTSIGSSNSVSYTIGIIITNYYSSDSSTADAVVTVSKPIREFVTGGGYLILSNSSGVKAGDPGTKNNFGFNVKYSRSGLRLNGIINSIFRRTENHQLHTFQLKGTSFYTLVVDSVTGKFSFTGKGNVYDISDNDDDNCYGGWSHHRNTVLSNATFRITGTDRGDPGVNDSLSITIYDNNVIWFTSRWNGSVPSEQKLGHGNVVARCGNLNTRQVEISMDGIATVGLEQNYPNPANEYTYITLQSREDKRLAINFYDINGRLVRELPEQEFLKDEPYTLEIDVAELPSGIYFYQVVGDGVNVSRKMWVVH